MSRLGAVLTAIIIVIAPGSGDSGDGAAGDTSAGTGSATPSSSDTGRKEDRIGPLEIPGVVAASTSSSPTGRPGADAAGGEVGPPDQSSCTQQVDGAGLSQAISTAAPGERICVTGDVPGRLEIARGGSDQAPLHVVGNGASTVKGITVKADNVLIDGFQVREAQAPAIELTGNNITAQNNTVDHPQGGDGDGIRFFGNYIKILHNTVSNTGGCGGCHADCMQTFTNDRPSSEHVLIDGNRCEKIANICLMAEGPGDVGDGGGGDGTSADWTYSNNYCEFGASQGLMIEAVQNVTIRNNQFEGNSDKAIGLDIGSTGATVAANLLGQGIDHEVGMDAKSRQGYQGPEPQGGP